MPSDEKPYYEEPELALGEAHGSEELESEFLRAKAELEELRRKQEQIEKEKQRLEELKKRQEALEEGRQEMLEKLHRALAAVSKEMEEGLQRQEQLRVVQRAFTEHVRVLESLNPKGWGASEAAKELAKAQGFLDEARADFQRAQARLSVAAPESAASAGLIEEEEAEGERDFGYWLKSGFAFTLPLQVLGLLGLLLWAWQLISGK